MAKFWKRIIRDETGQALPVVLILLVLGGLVIAPSLSYAATSLDSGRNNMRSVNGLYAADAGVQDALWCLAENTTVHTSLSETINGMTVTIQTETKGDYVLYAGEWVTGAGHYDWLTVTGEMVWDGGAGAYKYTITVTREPEASGNIKLVEVGAKLPVGYSYQAGSAALFGENLSTNEPDDELDGAGAHLLDWEISPEATLDAGNPTRTQIFYATGTGPLEGHYAWVIANRADVGAVGELSGAFYIVTATATEGGETTAVIVADVMMSEGVPYITAWKINPQ